MKRINCRIVLILVLGCIFYINNPLFAQNKTDDAIVLGDEKNKSDKPFVILRGKITDSKSKDPILGALVKLAKSNIAVVTDINGIYEMNMPQGLNQLEISYLGYELETIKLSIYENSVLDISLEEDVYQLEAVIIESSQADRNVKEIVPGLEKISLKDLQKRSQFMGEIDVLRSLQSMSGVTSSGEGSGGFNVRGGNIDENLIMQDGGLIINPAHSLGFFSLFHPDLVKEVNLYKGGLPAKYGGRMSSVLDVQLKEGNFEKFTLSGGVGFASSRLSMQGPIKKDHTSFIVGARVSYMDWLLGIAKDINVNKSKAFFYDITAKIDSRVTKTTKVGASVFATHDDFKFSDQAKFDYETRLANAYVNQLIGNKISLNAFVNIGNYTSSLYDLQGNNQSKFTYIIDYQRARLNAMYQANQNINFEVGGEYTRYKVSPGHVEPTVGESIVVPETIDQEYGYEVSPYLQGQFTFFDKVELLVGVRYTMYKSQGPASVYDYQDGVPKEVNTIIDTLVYGEGDEIINYSGFEPRVLLNFHTSQNSSLKLGYNRGYQYISQISNTSSATPIDIWQLSNYHLKPQSANNFSAGFYKNFRGNTIEASIEGFYREIDNLIDYQDFAQLLVNDHIETELVTGIGKTYGVEFNFKEQYKKHEWDINYTYSRSLRQITSSETQESINGGDWYPSNYDKPHVLNVNYSVKTGRKARFTTNFTYSTGRPTTAPISSYKNLNIYNIPVYSDRNQYRIPDYHRLDVSYTIGPFRKKGNRWSSSWAFSIYNVYARKNAYSVFFKQKAYQNVEAYRIAVLGTIFPSITYNFDF